ncbi:S1 family peptidase [Methylotenera versatilis]|uniref:S1 family peptidase n=1 Tax=Methylotenera versatilis TaxID=1055487 RepID=UPI000645ABF7|nr:serine protease [Methylotenera versatilis]
MRLALTVLGLFFCQISIAEPSSELTYKLKASVIKVHVATKTGGHGVGTGVVVGKDLVATNCHVLANAIGATITKFGDSYTPVSLKADWKHDLCILRFQYAELTPVELGDSEHLKYEQAMFSIGFPGGTPKPLVTFGKIKALYPLDDSSVVRSDASFVMGSSGSPVFDNDGKLIAISTFKSPGRSAYYYSVPVKWVKALLAAPESSETTSMKTSDAPFWDALDENRPYFMRVVLPYQNGYWAELKTVAAAWLAKEPSNAEALYYLATAEDNLGNANKANQYYEQVLKLHPNHPATLIALGLMANRNGNASEVEKTRVALKAIDLDLDAEFTEALKK